jgi:hypothetical protein
MPAHRTFAAWAFLALGILLPIGWLIACLVNWDNVVHSHIRLGYLIGDVGLVTPLSLVAAIALLRNRPFGPPVLLLAVGALAYDVVHFCVFLVQERFLLPAAVWIVIWVAVLALLAWIAAGEIRLAVKVAQ